MAQSMMCSGAWDYTVPTERILHFIINMTSCNGLHNYFHNVLLKCIKSKLLLPSSDAQALQDSKVESEAIGAI